MNRSQVGLLGFKRNCRLHPLVLHFRCLYVFGADTLLQPPKEWKNSNQTSSISAFATDLLVSCHRPFMDMIVLEDISEITVAEPRATLVGTRTLRVGGWWTGEEANGDRASRPCRPCLELGLSGGRGANHPGSSSKPTQPTQSPWSGADWDGFAGRKEIPQLRSQPGARQ
jgi:hypothetical protein